MHSMSNIQIPIFVNDFFFKKLRTSQRNREDLTLFILKNLLRSCLVCSLSKQHSMFITHGFTLLGSVAFKITSHINNQQSQHKQIQLINKISPVTLFANLLQRRVRSLRLSYEKSGCGM